ncbi:MAG TPA: SprT family zinc-dependent metalloprotease [Usitatibacter sp.]|nr:SprT family zinc-dependent metalloprotease [Usitatibacter sp.]
MPSRDLFSRDLRRLPMETGTIDYVLVRRRGRRGVGLKVDEGGLTVSAPVSMPLARIEDVVRESEAWVRRKVLEWSSRRPPQHAWVDGARLPYLGSALTLKVTVGRRAHSERLGDVLQVTLPAQAEEAAIRRSVVAWYKAAALAHLSERVRVLCAASGIAPPALFISPAMARWGSCNSRREVRLAWRLVKAPPALVDYVVCHELAHLRHMNHSAAFWAEVARLCPDYRERRRELFATDYLYRSF